MTSKDNRPEQTAGKETAQGVGGLGSGAGGQGLGKRGMNMGRGLNPGGPALVKKSHLREPWDRAARRPIRLSRRKSPLAPLWQRGVGGIWSCAEVISGRMRAVLPLGARGILSQTLSFQQQHEKTAGAATDFEPSHATRGVVCFG